MKRVKAGDVVYSSRHKGALLVVVAGSRTLICRKCKKDGAPGLQEVVVERERLTGLKLRLPT